MKTMRVCLSLLFLVWSLPVDVQAGGKYDGSIIKDRTVAGKKLKKKAVGTKELANYAVTTGKLANGAVTASKLNANLLADPNVVYVSTTGSAGGDGTIKSPYGSLYDAVVPANSGKTIVVMPGTYNFTTEILIDGSFSNMTIMGLSQNPEDTLLNSTDDTERIFNVDGGMNITIMNFDFTSTNDNNGGAVYLDSCTIKNCSFTNCYATNGGGVYSYTDSIVSDCKFSGCDAIADGGGVYAFWNSAVSGCKFSDCDATYGGGVWASTGVTVSDCEFNNCDATYGGGGMFAYENSTVSNCKFSDCDATTLGGGIYAGNNSRIKFCDIPRGDCPGKINSIYLTTGTYIQASVWDDDGDAGDFVVHDAVGNDACP